MQKKATNAPNPIQKCQTKYTNSEKKPQYSQKIPHNIPTPQKNLTQNSNCCLLDVRFFSQSISSQGFLAGRLLRGLFVGGRLESVVFGVEAEAAVGEVGLARVLGHPHSGRGEVVLVLGQ